MLLPVKLPASPEASEATLQAVLAWTAWMVLGCRVSWHRLGKHRGDRGTGQGGIGVDARD